MAHMLVRHTVEDFERWRPVYEEHAAARREAGLSELFVWRKEGQPERIYILFEIDDLDRAIEFAGSDDLQRTMEKAGVVAPPDVAFLYEA